jgi:hypothetical protein
MPDAFGRHGVSASNTARLEATAALEVGTTIPNQRLGERHGDRSQGATDPGIESALRVDGGTGLAITKKKPKHATSNSFVV